MSVNGKYDDVVSVYIYQLKPDPSSSATSSLLATCCSVFFTSSSGISGTGPILQNGELCSAIADLRRCIYEIEIRMYNERHEMSSVSLSRMMAWRFYLQVGN